MSLKLEAEIQLESDACVAAWDNKLFIGTEDGTIKSYNASLSPDASWAAHGVQIFALAAKGGRIYSTSNDGGVRIWSPTGEKITELPGTGGDIGALCVSNSEVIAGDEAGTVVVYENDLETARYNLLEEVKSIAFLRPFLFSVRDLDIIVTEIKPDESKTRYLTRHTMPGRAPLRTSGDKLLAMARGGNDLQLFDVNPNTTFKKLHEIKVSDMIVTSLAVSGDYAWTGGWDGHLRRWKISSDKLEPEGDIVLGSCINAVAVSDHDNAYAALAGGKVVRVKNH